MRKYRPRRAGAQWREGAPEYILDVFDNPNFADRYTVFFTGAYLVQPDEGCGRANTYVQYLGMSDAPTHPQGVSQWGAMRASHCAEYRYENGHRRIRWLGLPEHIREHVIARAGE